MARNLFLLPFENKQEHEQFECFSYTVLNCKEQNLWFDNLLKGQSKPAPSNFTSHLSGDGKPTLIDAYGNRIKFLTVKQILHITNELIKLNYCFFDRNLAVINYLKCLNEQTKVALFWS